MAFMFYGGERISGSGLDTLTIRNPANGEEVDEIPRGGATQIDEAVNAAREAFLKWSRVPASKRGQILLDAAAAVESKSDELAPILVSEQGKPLREAKLELHAFVRTLRHYGGMAKNIRGGYVPDLDTDTYGMIVRRPLGVIGAIIPWNFPTTLLANKLGPALVTGNTIVAKPAETTPLVTTRIAQIMHEAGLPAGVFNVVTGRGSEAGEALAAHPLVRKLAFTGSTPIGKMLVGKAAVNLKRTTMELGGSDPMIVCDDANLAKAASAASVGRFFNCGQACLAIKRVFVFDSVADEFIQILSEKVGKLKLGAGMERGTMLGPLHTAGGREEVEEQVQSAVDSGAKVLHGAKRPDGKEFRGGNFYEPTLLIEPSHDSRVAREEVFGPALPVWRVADLDEAIERANGTEFGLGSSVWTADLNRASEAAERIEAGYTWVNSPQVVYDELPFGGWKESGYGKEHGIEALDYYTETKAVVVKRHQ